MLLQAAGDPGRVEQLVDRGHDAALECPEGRAESGCRWCPLRPVGAEGVGAGEQRGPAGDRHQGADDLADERVRGARDRAAGVGRVDPDEAEPHHAVEVESVDQGDQAGQRDRFGEGDDLHDVPELARQRPEFGAVHVRQAHRRRDPSAPVPAQGGVLERSRGQAGPHDLAQVQRVALRRPVHLLHRRRFERGAQGSLDQGRGLGDVERFQVDAFEQVVLPERAQGFGECREVPAGQHEPRVLVPHEPGDVAGRQGVEQVGVVDPEEQVASLGLGGVPEARLGRHGFGQVVAQDVPEPVRHRAEGHRRPGSHCGDRHDQRVRVLLLRGDPVGDAGGDGGLAEPGGPHEGDTPPVLADDGDRAVLFGSGDHGPGQACGGGRRTALTRRGLLDHRAPPSSTVFRPAPSSRVHRTNCRAWILPRWGTMGT